MFGKIGSMVASAAKRVVSFVKKNAVKAACVITGAKAVVGSAQAQITNADLSGVASTVGTNFNAGLALSVTAGTALLILAYFWRAARRR